jgi:methionyl-tRNA synthetase
MDRRILITAALPYANGPVHLGHMVEYIQADIWARYHKSCGRDCVYVCANDTHGTPIMLRAQAEKVDPQVVIDRYHADHARDFEAFDVGFDNFYTTHSPENREFTETFFRRLREKGDILARKIEQAYCDYDQMFLPDRYIRGECPKCHAPDQYGDSCEKCGTTYSPTDLIGAKCAVCGKPASRRSSEHFFFRITAYEEMLRQWISPQHLHPHVVAKLQEWFKEGLKDWDFTRDAPYWGFLVPGTTDKFFYVWFDAPIGYLASTKNWCDRNSRKFEDYWVAQGAEVYHFIGKDILYFHALYWPAMLAGAGFRTPDRIWVHGFLTVDGVKMSKSRGTFINAATYLKHLDPQYLRYYYACKLGPDTADIDLSTQDFAARVNADLVGNYVNLPSRSSGLLKKLDSRLGAMDDAGIAVFQSIYASGPEIRQAYEACEYATAMRLIKSHADTLNRYFDAAKPWELVKTEPERARTVLTTTLNGVRLLAAFLGPVLPRYAEKIGRLLKCPTPDLIQDNLAKHLRDYEIGPYERIAERLDPAAIEAVIEATKAEQGGSAGEGAGGP